MNCPDCGIDPWDQQEDGRSVHEDFYVSGELWDQVCPDDHRHVYEKNGRTYAEGRFAMCIGCFETRLGRPLTRVDFLHDPREVNSLTTLAGIPISKRYAARLATPKAS
jgi:hypothetical protein